MGKGLELEIPADPQFLGLVRAVVATAASIDPQIRDERIDDLRLAVSEATTNAIEAHSRMESDERVVIRCNLAGDFIEVEVHDQGEGYGEQDLTAHPPVHEPERLDYERGLGLPLMRILADEHEVKSGAHGTSVRLVVYGSGKRKKREIDGLS